MASHIHQRAAARLVKVVEPVAVWTRVFFAVAQVVDVAECTFANQLAHTLVLWREAQFLRIHQLAVLRRARGDHLVRLLDRQAERLLQDDVLACGCRAHGGLRMQVIGQTDVGHLVILAGERLLQIRGPLRNAVLLRERARVIFAPGVDAHDLGVGYETVVALGVDVGDEPGANQEHSGSRHVQMR